MFAVKHNKLQSFAQKAKPASSCIFLVRGADTTGHNAWYYIQTGKNKQRLFTAQQGTALLDINRYGTVLYSGYGDEPPTHIKKQIQKLTQI